MRRRDFLMLLLSGADPTAAWGGTAKTYLIGYLSGSARVPHIDAFVEGLRELGYVEGQNSTLEFQLAAGQMDRLPEMATTLVRHNVDVIVAATSLAGIQAKRATSTIPIVVIASHDGIGTGLFQSLAHPGGNITGIESLAPSLDAKRVEILKEVLPQLSRIAIIYNPQDPGAASHVGNAKQAAALVASNVALVEVRSPADFDRAFQIIGRQRPDAMIAVTDSLLISFRKRIVGFATEQKIPAMFEFQEFVQSGGLISYGPNLMSMWHRGAYYVDKILKGAKAGEIPVEQPTKFELVINLKTARALGLTIRESFLVRADKVIE